MSAELGRRILAEGHHRVNFAIVAAGENAASPHHEAGDRGRSRADEVVLCDFGGTMLDRRAAPATAPTSPAACTPASRRPSSPSSTPCCTRPRPPAVAAGIVGRPAEDVDAAARDVIAAAGYGDWFIHRTGHGIGVEEHEDPYIVVGNAEPLVAGNAFSIEPGIYVPGRWGARLEDIVVATDARPRSLNQADHRLVAVDA